MRALLIVTHLLGAGHLTRTAAIARALAADGHDVTLASGGRPTPLVRTEGLRLVQLPPVTGRADDLRTLRDEAGAPAGPDLLAERRDRLVGLIRGVRPDVLVTELYPFGRRALAAEFEAVLDAAGALDPAPLLACSVRDILVAPATGSKADTTHRRLARYDAVLVHGDPALVTLDASWPWPGLPRAKLHYTGYVDEPAGSPNNGIAQPTGEVLVSGGSSAAGLPLYRAALEAARLLPALRWRLLVGHGVPEADVARLAEEAPPAMVVERARPDFRALLGGAALFVGQAGYNTAVDLLATGAPAVLVPFEAGQETEQRLRAEKLAERGRALVLPEAELSGVALAARVRDALAAPPPPPLPVDLDGAGRSARLLAALVAGRGLRP